MLLLGIDTSAAVSACVHDGARVLAEAFEHDPRRHAELLAPMVTAVLAEAGADRRDLTGIAVGVGPGPFTGLRVGLVSARVLSLALGVQVHGVCSLDALAAQAVDEQAEGLDGGFLVATDARRREVYWARYAVAGQGPGARASRVDGPHVGAPAAVAGGGLPAVGRGAALYREHLPGPDGPLDARAGHVAGIAAAALGAGDLSVFLAPEPAYLRRPDAAPPGPPKPVLR